MKRSTLKIYPFLVAIYPILALWNHNITYVRFTLVFRSLIVSVVAAGLVCLLFRFLIKDWQKAGLMTTLSVLLFFSYGHVYLFLRDNFEGLARHSLLVGFFLGVFIFIGWLVVRKVANKNGLEQFLTVIGVVLVSITIIQIGWNEYLVVKASREAGKHVESRGMVSNPDIDLPLPDVYLIILDAHARSDVLEEVYSYDDSEFINELTEMGFYVGECSQSNYPSTKYSLSTVMNLDYYENIVGESQVLPPLKSSVVKQTLDNFGYTTIAFENRARGHFDLGEDIHLSRNLLILNDLDLFGGENEFESMLIETSFLRLLSDLHGILPDFLTRDKTKSEFYEHYLQTHFILDELMKLPEMDGPIFVFAHILVPHDPYIFAPNGEYDPVGKGPLIGYKNNVEFIDSRMQDVLQTIIDKSEIPPIIIVMGDHGPRGNYLNPEHRMAILNVYYVDEETQKSLYGSISPVNTFRVILNHYFGEDYPLIEDVSFFANKYDDISEYILVPNNCTGK